MFKEKEINFRFNLYEGKKFSRKLLKVIIILAGSFLTYCLGMIFILSTYSKKVSSETTLFFFEKSPDLIAVFTGDKGRLEYAFKMLEAHPESKLLISGVNTKNTIQSLIASKAIKLPPNYNEELLSQVVELDYQARNTLENVLMTMQIMKKNSVLQQALIISSDYHLLRVKLLFSLFNRSTLTTQLHFIGVQSEQSFLKRLYDASIEGMKILRTLGLYVFWNDEDYSFYEENSNSYP